MQHAGIGALPWSCDSCERNVLGHEAKDSLKCLLVYSLVRALEPSQELQRVVGWSHVASRREEWAFRSITRCALYTQMPQQDLKLFRALAYGVDPGQNEYKPIGGFERHRG